jgi:hypothetical protein
VFKSRNIEGAIEQICSCKPEKKKDGDASHKRANKLRQYKDYQFYSIFRIFDKISQNEFPQNTC